MDLPQSSYPGFKIRLWVNYPQRLYLTIVDPAVGPEPTKEALQRVILEHNHWRDYEGNEYPQPGDEDFWTSIPDELLAILIVMIKQVPYQLPNSLRPTSRTSGGTSSPPPTTPASSSPGS